MVRGNPSNKVSAFAIGLGEPFGDDRHDNFVGHELSAGHILVRFLADLGLGVARRAEHVAGREVRELVFLDQLLRPGCLCRRPGGR